MLGAGDAFMAGFLRGWLRDEPLGRLLRLRQCLRRAGRVAPRLRAGDAELDRAAALPRARLADARAARRRRARAPAPRHHAHAPLAASSRCSPSTTARSSRSSPRGTARRTSASRASSSWSPRRARGARAPAGRAAGVGIILDDRFGEDVLPTLTGTGWWIARPVELPGSRPLRVRGRRATVRSTLRELAGRARRQVPGELPPATTRRRCAQRSSSALRELQRPASAPATSCCSR